MPSEAQERVGSLLTEFRRMRERTLENFQRVNEIEGTATAPRQAVKVSVSARGAVTAIEFPTGAYRRMAPKELADTLCAVIAEARGQAIEEMTALLAGQLPEGTPVKDLVNGDVAAATAALDAVRPPAELLDHLGVDPAELDPTD